MPGRMVIGGFSASHLVVVVVVPVRSIGCKGAFAVVAGHWDENIRLFSKLSTTLLGIVVNSAVDTNEDFLNLVSIG